MANWELVIEFARPFSGIGIKTRAGSTEVTVPFDREEDASAAGLQIKTSTRNVSPMWQAHEIGLIVLERQDERI